jgi:hypothetical protein
MDAHVSLLGTRVEMEMMRSLVDEVGSKVK